MEYENIQISWNTINQDNYYLVNRNDYCDVQYLYCEWCIDNICMGDVLHSIVAHNLNGLCDSHYDSHENSASEECECCLTHTVSKMKIDPQFIRYKEMSV